VGIAENVFKVMGSKVKVALWKSWELYSCWTAKCIWTKTYTDAYNSWETDLSHFQGHWVRGQG